MRVPSREPTAVLQIADLPDARIRTMTFDRPDALNAFNEALYDATTDALRAAAADPDVAVVVLTGSGRAFSTGTDVTEMAARTIDPDNFRTGTHGFPGMIDEIVCFPKPILCAVNGLALGVGATMLGLVDLVLMSRDARVRCPFTALAVAPEAASSYTFPLLMGRQAATWALMSSEWLSADECVAAGLAWRVCEPDALIDETMVVARVLASKPIASLVETKRTIVASHVASIAAARERENNAFARLLGLPANLEAFRAFAERREPDFPAIDREHPYSPGS
jgi:enoyl-CoA hydratase/carnithine racemase